MAKLAAYVVLSFIIVLAISLALERAFSPSFNQCISRPETDKQATQNKEGPSPLGGLVGSYVRCTGEFIETNKEAVTAFATLVIAAFTCTLWLTGASQLSHARKVDRAYVTGGGDIWTDEKTGRQYFRLDIENHGQTPAFVRAYDVRFAKLADLQDEFPKVRKVEKRPLIDGVSPQGGRRRIFTKIEREKLSDDAVFGAVWYEDVWGDEHPSRFILRIAETNDIKGEGLTRLDVRGVGKDYSDWDYPKKKQKRK